MNPRSSLMRKITTVAYRVARAKAYRESLPEQTAPDEVDQADERIDEVQQEHSRLLEQLKQLDGKGGVI